MTSKQKRQLVYSVIAIAGVGIIAGSFIYPVLSNQFNILALVLTLGVLLRYACDTNRIANETASQTELHTMPIMALYIRNRDDGKRDEWAIQRLGKYAITRQENQIIGPSPFYIALRNMGKGPAFNTIIESENFVAEIYDTHFYGPDGDEHAVKIIRKPANKIRSLTEMNGEMFTVKCESVVGKKYQYRYKVVNVEERAVEFLK